MQPDVQRYINAVWLLVAISWAVGVVRAKPSRGSPLARCGNHALG